MGQLPEGETRAGLTEYDGTHLNGTPHTTFTERVQYERELTPVPGEAGPAPPGRGLPLHHAPQFLLQAQRYSARRHDMAPHLVRVEHLRPLASSTSRSTAPGLKYNTSDRVAQKSSNQYVFANHTESTHTFDYDGKGEDMTVEMQFTGGGAVSGAWLNFMTVNYTSPPRPSPRKAI